MNADTIELQARLDIAARDNSAVDISRSLPWIIDAPLMLARFEDGEYKQHSGKIIGNSTMCDVSNGNIIAEFGDAPILSVHKGKGCKIEGLSIKGTGVGRDSRYSPYAALAIDPVCGFLPADGGYPGLKDYYKGSESKAGSTGIRINDCTFDNVTVGTITSPNGHTQNCEMIAYTNIGIKRVKYGFAGCQAQEKLNTVFNVQTWEKCEYLIRFNTYGECTPGHWAYEKLNIAGEVDYLVYRGSHEYYPLSIKTVFGERLIGIGYWQTFLNDILDSATIDLRYPDEVGFMPRSIIDAGGSSGGLTLRDCNIRYYGRPEIPMVFIGQMKDTNENKGRRINVIPYKPIEGVTYGGYGKVNPSLNALYLNEFNNDYQGISWNGHSSQMADTNYNIGIYQ